MTAVVGGADAQSDRATPTTAGNTSASNEQFFVNDLEVIKISPSASPEYQYYLKDHLGNNRVTFTTKDETIQHNATLEDNTQSAEQATFRNYSRVTNDLFDHTDAGTTYNKAQLLNGGNNSQVGISKSFAVMPGDVITAQVYAKHYGATGSSGNLAGFAGALLSAFGLPAPIAGETGTASAAIQAYGTFIAGGGNPGNPAWTKGFLNILIFDKNYTLIELAYQQLDAAFVQPVGSGTKMPHQLLSQTKTIKEPGYVYIYVSNEASVQKDIYFDDMTITHTKSRIVQANDYYPFGLTFNSYQKENSTRNNNLYNGKEFQDELNLGWMDYGARMLDPTIGRWNGIDPYSDVYEDLTPYNYALNNPTSVIDSDGQLVVYVNGFRVGAYGKYLEDEYRRSTSYGVPYEEAPAPWVHSERFYQNDVYRYWSQFDLNFWNGSEDRLFVDGMYYPKSSGGDRFDKGKAEGKLLAEKIKSGEITLEDGETIKLIGHSHGGAHAMGMAQGLLDAGIDCDLISVFLFAPHQPNQIPKVDVKVYQFSREGDKVSSKGKAGSTFTAIDGANFNKMPDGNDDQLGNHGIQTYTSEEVRQQNPELYQWLVDQGIINQDGSLKNN